MILQQAVNTHSSFYLIDLNRELKEYLHRKKKEGRETLIRMGHSVRDRIMEPWLRGAYLLDLSAQTKFRLMSTTRGNAVVRVPLKSIQKFIPNEILKDKFEDEYVNVFGRWHFFWDGDWDQQVLSIDQHYTKYSTSYRSMLQQFEKDLHYSECDEYLVKSERLKKGENAKRGNSIRELEGYFKKLGKLFEQIKENGYKTQKELKGRRPDDEIGVFVGRDGSLIKPVDKFHGTHRFAIARILKLDTVPVCIRAVHSEWGEKHFDLLLDGGEKLEKYFRG